MIQFLLQFDRNIKLQKLFQNNVHFSIPQPHVEQNIPYLENF